VPDGFRAPRNLATLRGETCHRAAPALTGGRLGGRKICVLAESRTAKSDGDSGLLPA
jgi:hypothetical protein